MGRSILAVLCCPLTLPQCLPVIVYHICSMPLLLPSRRCTVPDQGRGTLSQQGRAKPLKLQQLDCHWGEVLICVSWNVCYCATKKTKNLQAGAMFLYFCILLCRLHRTQLSFVTLFFTHVYRAHKKQGSKSSALDVSLTQCTEYSCIVYLLT